MEAIVALESTVFAHGLPHPQNVETALRLEAVVRAEHAIPRTIGIIRGRIMAAMTEAEIHHLAESPDVRKVSVRDLPVVVARRLDGATTVSATAWIAHRSGVKVMATGGIGGVHRTIPGASPTLDVSADLEELARTPIAVVCAGPKAILDLAATREYLETRGVTLIGYQTDEMPAFYTRNSGLPVDVRCDTPEEVAAIVRARIELSLSGACLIVVPVPTAHELPTSLIEPAIRQALDEAGRSGILAERLTPFLLDRLREITGGRSVETNRALLEHNAAVAARVARALAGLPLPA
ncbi:MAG TPA: pseudouridine-5'-phosphate glycosidase [Rhodothermales bacterium]